MKMDKLFEAIMEGRKKEVRVGRVSIATVKKMEELQAAHAKQHEELKARIKEFIEQVHAEHKPACDEYERKIADVWEQIYDEIGLAQDERDESYSLDRISGVITKEVVDDEAHEIAPGIKVSVGSADSLKEVFEKIAGQAAKKNGGLH